MESDPQATALPAGTAGLVCVICQSALGPNEPATSCPDCAAHFHLECWEENGGCAIYGCPSVPATEHRSALEIPASYWGQENKPCAACGREILAAAVRCRHCGATFSSGRPEQRSEFQRRAEINEKLPNARRNVVVLFVLSVIPCFAPVAAVGGTIWYRSNRETVKALPALYDGLCKIALAVGFGQTILIVLLVMLFSVLRTS